MARDFRFDSADKTRDERSRIVPPGDKSGEVLLHYEQ